MGETVDNKSTHPYIAQHRSAARNPGYVNPPYVSAGIGPRVQKRREAKRAVLTIVAVFVGAMLMLLGIGVAVAATAGPPATHNPLIDTVTATPPAAR